MWFHVYRFPSQQLQDSVFTFACFHPNSCPANIQARFQHRAKCARAPQTRTNGPLVGQRWKTWPISFKENTSNQCTYYTYYTPNRGWLSSQHKNQKQILRVIQLQYVVRMISSGFQKTGWGMLRSTIDPNIILGWPWSRLVVTSHVRIQIQIPGYFLLSCPFSFLALLHWCAYGHPGHPGLLQPSCVSRFQWNLQHPLGLFQTAGS